MQGHLALRFAGGEIHLDVCGSRFGKGVKNDSVQHTRTHFACAIDNGHIIKQGIPAFQPIDDVLYMNIEKRRRGLLGFFGRSMPTFAHTFSCILGYRIKE